jgi:hypothetical protein
MAQDLTLKRQNMAIAAINASTQLVDALNELLALRAEHSKLGEDFQVGDFVGVLAHLTPGICGQLFDFVIPSLEVNFTDTANGERNKQILLQMRK